MSDDDTITQRVARRVLEQQPHKPAPWYQRHLFELVLGVLVTSLLGLSVAGGMAYLDTRHVQRAEAIEQNMIRLDDEISMLQDYEAFVPNSEYSPARQSSIRRKVAQKEALQRQLERLKE